MLSLDSLEETVSSNSSNRIPSNDDFVFYLFFDKGIGFKEFDEMPIPYIILILKTHRYVKEQERKEHEKATKKRR